MGRWADALAAHLEEIPDAADEKTRHPPTGLPSKPSKGAFEPFEGEGVRGCSDFSSPIADRAPRAMPSRSICNPITDGRAGYLGNSPDARPYKLTPGEADAAHAEPWNDAAIARFVARVSLFLRRGMNATDADDLAERLHLRDVRGDDRVLCVECVHLVGRAGDWRCGNHRVADVARDLPAALTTTMQRCMGFGA